MPCLDVSQACVHVLTLTKESEKPESLKPEMYAYAKEDKIRVKNERVQAQIYIRDKMNYSSRNFRRKQVGKMETLFL